MDKRTILRGMAAGLLAVDLAGAGYVTCLALVKPLPPRSLGVGTTSTSAPTSAPGTEAAPRPPDTTRVTLGPPAPVVTTAASRPSAARAPAPSTTAARKPAPAAPAPTQAPSRPTCAGRAPARAGDPGYLLVLDADADGESCESNGPAPSPAPPASTTTTAPASTSTAPSTTVPPTTEEPG